MKNSAKKISVLIDEARFLSKLGRIEEARKIYQKVDKLSNNDSILLNEYLQILLDLTRLEEATVILEKLIYLKPEDVKLRLRKGELLVQLDKRSDALSLYKDLIESNPDEASVYLRRGLAYVNFGDFQNAISDFENASSKDNGSYDIYFCLGKAYYQIKNYDLSLKNISEALKINPLSAAAYNTRGLCHFAQRKLDLAVEDITRAVELEKSYVEAYFNLANCYFQKQEFEQSLKYYNMALQLNGEYFDALVNKTVTLSELNRTREALLLLDEIIKKYPDCDRAFANRAVVQGKLREFNLALHDIKQAIILNSTNPGYYSNCGIILKNLNRFDEAIEYYQKALAIDPAFEAAYGELLTLRMTICDWKEFEQSTKLVEEKIKLNIATIQPLSLLSVNDDPEIQLVCSRLFNQYDKEKDKGLDYKFYPQNKHDPINIGYFSADFHSHATMHLIAELIEKHNRKKFNVIGFSFGPKYDDIWANRARMAFDEFLDISDLSLKQAVLLARDKNLQVAIDLKGFTEDCRFNIFAERVAPIQISFLGYPGTMAAPYIDYIVADKTVIPEECKRFYEENIIFMPNSYQPNCSHRDIAEGAPDRKDYGLPETGVIFCCYNNTHKITPSVFRAWMAILNQVEQSVLWLYLNNSLAKKNIKLEAQALGVNPNRIIFANKIDVEEHLSRLQLADIFLDTYPYNAHTTASDALRMGLPIITLSGQSFASRVCASLLMTIGLECCITYTLEDYVARAIDLAKNKHEIDVIRVLIRNSVSAGPLFDSTAFVGHFEEAILIAHENFQQGLPPNDIFSE